MGIISSELYRVSHSGAPLFTKVFLPSSKSISNRVLIINALAYSVTEIGNLSDSDDTRVLKEALSSNRNNFDIGHAGTAMRFLTAFLSKITGEWTVTGSPRMKQRPIHILVDSLRKMGAHIDYLEQEGFPPLRILGSHLKGGTFDLDGSVSSQYISALLMIGPTLEGGLTLRLQNRITSRSYIEMTLDLMRRFGIQSTFVDNEIHVEEQPYRPMPFTVESDWSAASYWYEMLALSPSGEIELPHLYNSRLQGDAAIAGWFEAFGIQTHFELEGTRIVKLNASKPARLEINFHETPDMAQTMAVLCVAKRVPFHFTGLETLKIKETNRVEALMVELKKLGALLNEPAEGSLSWDGSIDASCVQKIPRIETYNDHRMALAFAPLAMLGKNIEIVHPGVVTKSYPQFWNDLAAADFIFTAGSLSEPI